MHFGYSLAREGALVVSGLARGIDASAHEGALRAGGITAAVVFSLLASLLVRPSDKRRR